MATDYTYSSELFFDELLRISSSIVWKNPTLALQNEDPEEAVNIEQYILAKQGRLTFTTVHRFSEEVLKSFRMSDEMIASCQDNRELIPINIRDKCVERQTDWQLKNYVEKNNYYRMLNGLPDKEDTQFFYNLKYPDISDNITPLHLMKPSLLRLLSANGYIDELIKANPKKKYLRHLTEKKIDIYKARNSKEFSILWMTSSDSDNLVDDFTDTYMEARGMMMAVFYQKVMSESNAQYSGFVGMMILFQTLMLMQKNFLDVDITRDFYDVESLRLVYDSYDIPFYQNIPLEYHKRIVKNVNILLSHKGSTRVFYDLFDIFGFNNIALYSFYMLKARRIGNNGKPIIVKDQDGNLDLENMYDIDFVKVPMYEDPILELRNPHNKVLYEEVIMDDKYWFSDKDLIDKIYKEEFNYMESKYIGIQLTANLMQIMYETTYYLKLILDNREILAATTTIYNPALHTNMNIFDMVIYLSALITKKYGFEGNIPRDPHEIGAVMGFNFKLDLERLKENMSEDEFLKKDKKLFTLLSTMDVNDLNSVKQVYTNLTGLRNYLVKKMAKTSDVKEYWAYYELHQTLMYSEYTDEAFKKNGGDTAKSFADLLMDINPRFYARYETLEEAELNSEIVNMLYLAKTSCTALKHIQYADSLNIDVMIEYLYRLIDFFKSAKADLTGYNVVYSLVSSADNIMKLMQYMDRINDDYTSDPQYSIFDELTDMIAWIKDRMNLCDKYTHLLQVWRQYDTTMLKWFVNYLTDYIKKCTQIFFNLVDSVQKVDYLSEHKEIFLPDDDEMRLRAKAYLLYEDLRDCLKFKVWDEWKHFDVILSIIDNYTTDPLETKIDWLMKIAVIYEQQRIGKSEYVSRDYIHRFFDVIPMEVQYRIIDEIIRIYKDHTQHLDVTLTTKSFVDHINVLIKLEDMRNAGFEDTEPEIQEILLILEDYKNNKIHYLTELSLRFMREYPEDIYRLIQEVKFTDTSKHAESLPHLASFLHRQIDRPRLYEPHEIQDRLFEVFSDLQGYLVYKVHIEAEMLAAIYEIHEKQEHMDTEFPQDSKIDTIRGIFTMNDMDYGLRDVDPIIREILLSYSNHKIQYLTQMVIKVLKYYPKEDHEIRDILSYEDKEISLDTYISHLVTYICKHKDIQRLSEPNEIKDKLYEVFTELGSNFVRYQVQVEAEMLNEIFAILENLNHIDSGLYNKDDINKYSLFMSLIDKNTHLDTDITNIRDIGLIYEDICDTFFTYVSEIAIKVLKYYPEELHELKEDVIDKNITLDLDSYTYHIANYIYSHYEVPHLSDPLDIQDKLYETYSKLYEVYGSMSYKVQIESYMTSKLFEIREIVDHYDSHYSMDNDITSINNHFTMNDMDYGMRDTDPKIKEIIKSLEVNKIQYLDKLAIKILKELPRTKALINEDYVHMENILEPFKTKLTFIQDNVEKENVAIKTPYSRVELGERLFLVREETFEDV